MINKIDYTTVEQAITDFRVTGFATPKLGRVALGACALVVAVAVALVTH